MQLGFLALAAKVFECFLEINWAFCFHLQICVHTIVFCSCPDSFCSCPSSASYHWSDMSTMNILLVGGKLLFFLNFFVA